VTIPKRGGYTGGGPAESMAPPAQVRSGSIRPPLRPMGRPPVPGENPYHARAERELNERLLSDPNLQDDSDLPPALRRQALVAEYGRPTFLGWRNRTTVAYRHDSEASAQAFSRFDSEEYGHVVTVERDGSGWVTAVDVSAAMAGQDEVLLDVAAEDPQP
jgi:hypothetical protein